MSEGSIVWLELSKSICIEVGEQEIVEEELDEEEETDGATREEGGRELKMKSMGSSVLRGGDGGECEDVSCVSERGKEREEEEQEEEEGGSGWEGGAAEWKNDSKKSREGEGEDG